MNFFKNISPIYLYMVSIICLVLSNVVREINANLYYALLVLGVLFFILGMTKRIKKQ